MTEPAAPEPTHLVVGHVNKPHGTRGEVFVWPLTDHPDVVFDRGARFEVADDAQSPDPRWPALRVEDVRPFRRGYLVAFGGFRDREDAERLRGAYLLRERGELASREEGEWFYHELLGLQVETVAGDVVGRVQEVYELRPADLIEVATPGGSKLIPFTRRIVRSVEPGDGRLVIDPPEGLLDL